MNVIKIYDIVLSRWMRRDRTVENGIRYGDGRRLFIWDGAVSTAIANIAAGTFIAGLVNQVGGSDAVNGVVGSFPVLTAPVQIFAALILGALHARKKAVILTALGSKLFSGLIFFIPLFFHGGSALPLLLGMFFFVNAFASFAGPGSTSWMIDLVPEHMRSAYFARREAVCLALTAIVSLLAGFAADFISLRVSRVASFAVFGLAILLLTVVNVIILTKIDEPPVMKPESGTSLKTVIFTPFRSKQFTAVLIFGALWNFGFMFGQPFMFVYMVSQLKLNYSYIMLLSTIYLVIRVILVPRCGRIAEKRGFYYLAKWSVSIIALSTIMWFFVTETTVYVILPLTYIVSAIGGAGFNLSLLNIQIMCMPAEIRTNCISVNSAVLGVAGFLSTLLASLALNVFEKSNFITGTVGISPIRMVFLVSSVILVLCEVYLFRFSAKVRE